MSERYDSDIASRLRGEAAQALASQQRSSLSFEYLVVAVAVILLAALILSAYEIPRAWQVLAAIISPDPGTDAQKTGIFVRTQGHHLVAAAVLVVLWVVLFRVFIECAFATDWLIRGKNLRVIDADSANGALEQFFVDTVQRRAKQLGLPVPRMALADEGNFNAFAYGERLLDFLVCITVPLLKAASCRELDGIICHELGHIANRDSRFLTLSLVVAHALGSVVLWPLRIGIFLLEGFARLLFAMKMRLLALPFAWCAKAFRMLLEMVKFLSVWVFMSYRREHEFRADAIAATLAGDGAMLGSLLRLNKLDAAVPVGRLESVHAFLFYPHAVTLSPFFSERTSQWSQTIRVVMEKVTSDHPETPRRILAIRAGKFLVHPYLEAIESLCKALTLLKASDQSGNDEAPDSRKTVIIKGQRITIAPGEQEKAATAQELAALLKSAPSAFGALTKQRRDVVRGYWSRALAERIETIISRTPAELAGRFGADLDDLRDSIPDEPLRQIVEGAREQVESRAKFRAEYGDVTRRSWAPAVVMGAAAALAVFIGVSVWPSGPELPPPGASEKMATPGPAGSASTAAASVRPAAGPAAAKPVPAPDFISGKAQTIDSAKLVVDGRAVRLFGLVGNQKHAGEVAAFINQNSAGALQCVRVIDDLYQCHVPGFEKLDIGAIAVMKGAAQASPEAPAGYVTWQEWARLARVGVWSR